MYRSIDPSTKAGFQQPRADLPPCHKTGFAASAPTRSPRTRALFRIALALLLLAAGTAYSSAKTGIELTAGNIADEPEWWSVEEADSQKPVAKVEGRWGFTSTPAGIYRVLIFPRGNRALPVAWDTVTVLEGKVSRLNIDSGISISGNERWTGPPGWWFLDDAGGKRVAQVQGRWGFTPLPPGKYRLKVFPNSDLSVFVDWGEIKVSEGSVSRLNLDSGVETKPGDYSGPTPDQWIVEDTAGRRVAQLKQDWGFMPLPPGKYIVSIPFGFATGKASVDVRPNQVSEIGFADLGVGRIRVEMPFARAINLVGAPEEFQLGIKRNGKTWGIPLSEGARTKQEVLGLEAGPLSLIFLNGSMEAEKAIRVEAGKEILVPFDAENLAREQGLSIFSLGNCEPENASSELLVARDADGEPLMLDSVAAGTRWIAPGNAYLRWRCGDAEAVVDGLPIAKPTSITVPSLSGDSKKGRRVWIDVAIQSPADGTVVEAEQLELVGRAATGAEAGTTQIALLIDTSGSTADPSGADLDGDGQEDSVLEAEVAAARLLVEELSGIEAQSPGDAFALGLLRFSDNAEQIAPLTRLSMPEATEFLTSAFDRLIETGAGGDTYYDKGLDAAVEAIEESGMRGPRIVLLMSDGKPSDLRGALAAATRTGRARTVIHAIGLGKDFKGNVPEQPRFPPYPSSGVETLGLIAALAHSGGEAFPSPRPGDAVAVLSRLPVLKPLEVRLESVRVENLTTGQVASRIDLRDDGSFVSQVPVSLFPSGEHEENTLRATAIALDKAGEANDEVRVRAPQDGIAERKARGHADCVRARARLESEISDLSAELSRCEQDNAKQRADCDATLDEAKTAVSSSKEEKQALAANLEKLQALLERSEAEHESLKNDQADLSRRTEECGLRVAELEEIVLAAERKASGCESERQTLHGECASLRERLTGQTEAFAAEKTRLETSLQQASNAHDLLESRLSAALSDSAATESDLESLRRERTDLAARSAQCEKRINELEKGLQEERKNTTACAAERRSLIEERAQLLETMQRAEKTSTEQNEELANKLKKAQTGRSAAEQALDSALAELGDARSRIGDQSAAQSRLEAELQRLARRIEELEPLEAALQETSMAKRRCEEDLLSTRRLLEEEQQQATTLQNRLEAKERKVRELQDRLGELERDRESLLTAPVRATEATGWLRVTSTAEDGLTPQYLLPQVELILDVSNSMWGQIDGEPKIAIARRVIRNVVGELPENIRVALRVYGHRQDYRSAGACLDSELLLPFATLDGKRLVDRVSGLRPKGKTPIAYSLLQVPTDFAGVGGQKVVVLVTDGQEECGGDPVAIATELANSGLNVIIHTVGFALEDEVTKESMRQVAEATEGRFVDAQSPSEVEDAISRSFRISYRVFGMDGKVKAEGLVDQEAIAVPAGVHRVVVQAPRGSVSFDRIMVQPDETIEVSLDNGKQL